MSLPNSAALLALTTLARTGSVTTTAATLSLTQSAISHKLKALEVQLGFALTYRDGRGVRLTERARHYVAEIEPALQILARAARTDDVEGRLTLNVAPGFAANWLGPRLGGFLATHPGIRLRINNPRGYGDLGTKQSDFYISFLRPDEVPPGAAKLMEVSFFPVAAPSLVAGAQLDDATLARSTLLHLDNREDWRRWMTRAGFDTHPAPGVEFQDLQVMQMAAEAGQGICLGDRLTSQTAMERGTLMRVHSVDMPSQRDYWLVEGRGPETDSRAAFRSWISAAL